tara:strand:+ start:1080 stop:2339 length:1260 start_codon:yes stop_codon:yes gene_type:complete
MKKEILNEINRNREIMGLDAKLLVEWNLGSTSAWVDFLQTYKGELYDNVEAVRPDCIGTSKTYTFRKWAAYLWDSLQNKYGDRVSAIDTDDWKMMAFVLGDNFLWSDDGMEEDVVVQQLTKQQVKKLGTRWDVKEGLPVINNDGQNQTPATFCRRINKFNFKNFGSTQVTSWKYNKGDKETELIREATTTELYMFSASKTNKSSEIITQAGTEGTAATVASEGEPIPGGSAFAVNEVIPDSTKVQELLTLIQNSAADGMDVTNVKINGVASEQVISNVATWKKNVGNEYNSMADADIVKLVTGDFTEPVTGNQVLAYLRAQNLGKELIKAGINVDSYSYSVGGDEMKADVMITTEKPAVEATKGTDATTSQEFSADVTDLVGKGKILSMVISVPEKMSWKKSGVSKDEAKEVIAVNQAS